MALICNNMACFDNDFAGIEFRLQNIGKHFERGKVRMFRRCGVKAD